MSGAADKYEIYYADKLWNLLPAVYRAQDTDQFGTQGPLREMVNRIGSQVAVVRRSIDRLWEDQSIETCDDWVIPYIGDLLATNLVGNLDPRGQRLDVAKTIYYRRRKGTVAILEEIAADITGWEAKVVEGFRRLARTRHGLDPEIGSPRSPGDDIARIQLAQGLVGPLSRTPMGGLADLRNVYGASRTSSAFDEFFHTADFRRGRGAVGRYNIPRLIVFLWRLQSYGVGPCTPVPIAGSPGCYTFDPTGRDIPLFAADSRAAGSSFGGNWVSPAEAQLPTPISRDLWEEWLADPASGQGAHLYPDSLAVFATLTPVSGADAVAPGALALRPERGRFRWLSSPPPDEVAVSYHYGFSSDIGAGPYDRRVGGALVPAPSPEVSISGGADAIAGGGGIAAAGTLTVADSLTYDGAADAAVDGALTLRAANGRRPLIRMTEHGDGAPAQWVITGAPGSSLALDGLFVSGGDIVLRGEFNSVRLNCCTLDPGSAAGETSPRPIREIPSYRPPYFPRPRPLLLPPGSPPQAIFSLASPPAAAFGLAADGRMLVPTRLWIEATIQSLVIDRCVLGPLRVRDGGLVEALAISDTIVQAIADSGYGWADPAADLALHLPAGTASLSRSTVLGPARLHRLEASECILNDVVSVEDCQDGCVRFCAWADGSRLPRQYESVRIRPRAALFGATDFGQPAYCQLLPLADAAILPAAQASAAPQNTISAGAQDGSEMGAFARAANPIKERSLLIKYQEYMPAGLVPVIVYVT